MRRAAEAIMYQAQRVGNGPAQLAMELDAHRATDKHFEQAAQTALQATVAIMYQVQRGWHVAASSS